jgi:hypothetical protein
MAMASVVIESAEKPVTYARPPSLGRPRVAAYGAAIAYPKSNKIAPA